MAVVRVYINSAAFSAGNPLADKADYKERVKIVVGTHQYSEPVVGGRVLAGGRPSDAGPQGRRSLVIDMTGIEFSTEALFNALPLEDFRLAIADLVDRGIVVVDKGGAAQTAAAVASASGI